MWDVICNFNGTLSHSTVVLYIRDHAELGFSSQKCCLKTSLNFQLGSIGDTAKPKNVLFKRLNVWARLVGILCPYLLEFVTVREMSIVAMFMCDIILVKTH